MINKRCPNPECNSTYTYAVPTRAHVKTGEDGKVILDAEGYPEKIMCRRCRQCGKDYYDDNKFIPKAPRSDTEMGALMRKLAAERGTVIK